MGFGRHRVIAKAKRQRGQDTIDQLKDNWDSWLANLNAQVKDEECAKEIEQLQEKLNEAVADSGDVLFAETAEEFFGEANAWTAKEKQAFCDILCPNYFEVTVECQ